MGWHAYITGVEDAPSHPPIRKPLILVVDDDYAVEELLRMCLEHEGFKVITARDGLEALMLLRRHKPDVVILDIYMPVLDGWGVLEVIRSDENLRHLPVILLTVERSPHSIIRGWDEGIDCFISKPFDPADLIAIIKRTLELKHYKEDVQGVEE
ncbi:MAG: response regulator [Armatimonadota bacterium]|nr:response regulator [Armatimonadota bacterium]MCX7776869.1 response regulator [Armatimonadota bacterium]MDW8024445.1 response regulator [Armatimonadota bacterium]